MSVGPEKMREMRRALKSAGGRLREFARFPDEHAAFLRQKAESLRERARRWRAGEWDRPTLDPEAWDRAPAADRLPWRERLEWDRLPWDRLRPRARLSAARPPAAEDVAPHAAPPTAFHAVDMPQSPPAPEARAEPSWRDYLPGRVRHSAPRPAAAPHAVPMDAFAVAMPDVRPAPQTRVETGWRDYLPSRARALRIAAIALAVFLAAPYALIPAYRLIDPPFSALMARQWLTGTSIRHQWVDLEDISPALPAAVITSEDSAFCRHWGVDWNAVGQAIEEADNGERFRGASTIPMQTAKNLFLWNGGASVIRKVLEIPQAYWMSALWPKRRVIEVYLNIAEWGPGIFGAEAAARHHFRKSAADLSPREAALLAAALPNPIRRNAGRPNGLTARIAARIGARVPREGAASCVLSRRR